MLPYTQLKINCETSPNVPPPYSHRYQLVIDENASHLILSFEQIYTDRDELEEDEILEEGFQLNDDFSWRGKLENVWKQQLDSLLEKTRLHTTPGGGDYTVLIESEHAGQTTKGFVGQNETHNWIYLIQELKQAIYETERIEAPLSIDYLHLKEDQETHIVLKGEFAERQFTVRVNDRPLEKWDWSVLQETINLLFNDTEIDPEKMLKGKPRYEGYYLQLPGMGWYALGKGIRSRYKDDSVIHEIIACMERFAGNA